MSVLPNYEISKKEYFQAAAEYYRVQAEIVTILETNADSAEMQLQLQELEKQEHHFAHIMHEYTGTYQYENDVLLRYPRNTKEEAKRDLRANEELGALAPRILTNAFCCVSAALISPLLIQLIESSNYSFGKLFLYALLFVPGLMVFVYLLGNLATYPLTKKASRMESELLEEKERFLARAKIMDWLLIIAATIISLLLSTFVATR